MQQSWAARYCFYHQLRAQPKVAAVTLGGVSLQHPDACCSPRWWRRGVGAQNVLCVLHQAANRPHHCCCCCALLSALLELGAGRRGVSTRKWEEVLRLRNRGSAEQTANKKPPQKEEILLRSFCEKGIQLILYHLLPLY